MYRGKYLQYSIVELKSNDEVTTGAFAGGGAGQLVPMIWCIGAQTSQLSKPLQKRVTNKNFDTILNHLKGHLQVHVCIAKVCFAQCSTSRLALGSRGCWLVVTMPKISLKTLYCYIFEKPKVQGHQN